MSGSDADKWNAIYAAGEHVHDEPAKVLKEFAHLLPGTGTALDLACGRGANALYLAEHGLNVHAWDISGEAITILNNKADQLDITLETRVCDITTDPIPPNSFDVIVVSYFLERKLMPSIINALRKNGLLFYQTYTKDRVEDTGPKNDNYRLAKNELLQLCRDLNIIFYHEEGLIGDRSRGFRNEAMLIGKRSRE